LRRRPDGITCIIPYDEHHITDLAMRYDAEHKQNTRRRVLQAASEILHADGVEGVGVAAVMSKAGLTHGAFYAHFPSKEALVAEATAQASVVMRERFVVRVAGLSPADALKAQLDYYLSPNHRDSKGVGCLLPSMCSDAARAKGDLREAYADVLATFVGIMQELLDNLGHDEPGLASSMAAEMVGALSLARAVDDDAHSTEILAASHASLMRRAHLAQTLA
jgi:TetR/AcrR family transcriptional repressor of nem operon